jgi:hypothetical protein
LVAALDDITESYEWGCFDSDVSGADGLDIGTGLQNSLDIVEGCSDTNCAAYMSLNAVKEVYTDWYLPSIRIVRNVEYYRIWRLTRQYR